MKLLKFKTVILFVLFTSWLLGCQSKPTKIYEKHALDVSSLVKKSKKPLAVTADTVVVDARTQFDYQMAHVPGSVHIRWETLSQEKGRFPGLITEDLDRAYQHLRLKGLHPDKPIIVVGYGQQGNGEEGRLAWTLYYLGFSDVQMASDQALNLSSNIVENPKPVRNATTWSANLNKSVLADKKEVVEAVTAKIGKKRKTTHLIDVRSQSEYFAKKGFGEDYRLPDLQAINIEWKEFFTADGRPNHDIKGRLKAVGIQPSDRLILVSNNGIRSAAVTMSLLSIGYPRAANLAMGYKGLLQQ